MTVALRWLAQLQVEKTRVATVGHVELEDVESGATGNWAPREAPDRVGEALRVRCGDVLFARLRPYLRKVVLADRELTASTEFLCLRASSLASSRFLRYVVSDPAFADFAVACAYGTKMPRVAWQNLRYFQVWAIPTEKQRAIADFLDRECERIDAAVVAARRPVDAAIHLPVRRALDDIALIRPPFERLRFGLLKIEQGWSPECWDRDRGPDEWGVLKLSCVSAGSFTPDHKTLPPDTEPRPKLEVVPGDVLMSRANTRALVGSAVVVPREVPSRLMLSDLLYRLRLADDRWYSPFVALVVNSPIGRRQIEAAAIGSSGSMPKISQAVIRDLRLPRPTIADQVAIAQRFIVRGEALDRAVTVAGQIRKRLANYRDSLIHEAVTGKLDVTRVSETEMDERLHAASEGRLDEVMA